MKDATKVWHATESHPLLLCNDTQGLVALERVCEGGESGLAVGAGVQLSPLHSKILMSSVLSS